MTLPDSVALHARPAAEFVRVALGFSSRIEVGTEEKDADAKSLMAVLALGAAAGTELRLRAHGDDAAGAVEALVGCVAAFG